MYQLPDALAPLNRYDQFILVMLVQAFDLDGAPIPDKFEKFPVSPAKIRRQPNPDDISVWHHNAHDSAIWMTCEQAAKLAESLPVPEVVRGLCHHCRRRHRMLRS